MQAVEVRPQLRCHCDEHRNGADLIDDRAIERVAGVEENDFIPGIEHCCERAVDRLRRTGCDEDIGRLNTSTGTKRSVLCDGNPQLRISTRRWVMRVALGHRRCGRIHDVWWGRKTRISNVQSSDALVRRYVDA